MSDKRIWIFGWVFFIYIHLKQKSHRTTASGERRCIDRSLVILTL